MPAVQRTSLAEIVAAARTLLDDRGPEAVTMAAVAASVGVRGPSLYKHVDGRGGLLRLVAGSAVDELGRDLAEAVDAETDPPWALAAAVRAFRAFAHRSPHAYGLIFGPGPHAERPSEAILEHAAEPVFRAVAALVPSSEVLPAARTVTAWASGFVSMELTGAFRLGGEVAEAFEWGLRSMVEAVVSAGSREAATGEPGTRADSAIAGRSGRRAP
ncbi:TetR/AcrR family transcriptional regulator [Luethyella okanaganae]|uniref:TetR/AcrR family transcriptional regulator n=1 Tax=Luethyella okanaganae TaxID=69372 RepID=A0ABW1VCX9_9MICO